VFTTHSYIGALVTSDDTLLFFPLWLHDCEVCYIGGRVSTSTLNTLEYIGYCRVNSNDDVAEKAHHHPRRCHPSVPYYCKTDLTDGLYRRLTCGKFSHYSSPLTLVHMEGATL
jgi:hypothetical protein